MCVRFVALFILTLTLCYLELTILRLLNDYVNAASIKWNAYEMCSKINWTKFNSWNYFLPFLFLIFVLKYNKQSFSKYFIEIKKIDCDFWGVCMCVDVEERYVRNGWTTKILWIKTKGKKTSICEPKIRYMKSFRFRDRSMLL